MSETALYCCNMQLIVTSKELCASGLLIQRKTTNVAKVSSGVYHDRLYLVPEPEPSVPQVLLGRHGPWRRAAEALRQALRSLPPL